MSEIAVLQRDAAFPLLTGDGLGNRPRSRLIASEDADNREWVRYKDPLGGDPQGDTSLEDVGVWERTHLLYGLDRGGCLGRNARVLVVATMPDPVIGLLSERAGRVEVYDLKGVSRRKDAEARLFWSHGAPYARDRLVVHDRGARFEQGEGGAYDTVVFPHGSMFDGGVAGIAGLLSQVHRLIRKDGMLAFKAEVFAGSEPDWDHLDVGLLAPDRLPAMFEAWTGFAVEGGFDARLSAQTAERVGAGDDADPDNGALLSRRGGRLRAPGLWFLRKREEAVEGGWKRLEGALLGHLLGDQTSRLQIGSAGRRDEQGRIATIPGKQGLVFWGLYICLPEGRYEARFLFDLPDPSRRNQLDFEIVCPGSQRQPARVNWEGSGTEMKAVVAFGVAPTAFSRNGSTARMEIRARTNGLAATLRSCELACVDTDLSSPIFRVV